jgi:hypothetical protein
MMEGIKAWLIRRTVPNIKTIIPEASDNLRVTYECQTRIGWDHLMRGRLATNWGIVINRHLISQNNSKAAMTPERWGQKVVEILWEMFLEIWQNRSNVEHWRTPEEQDQIKHGKLLTEIQHLQQSEPHLTYSDRDWFYTAMETLTTFTTTNLMAWTRNAKALVKINAPICTPIIFDDHG